MTGLRITALAALAAAGLLLAGCSSGSKPAAAPAKTNSSSASFSTDQQRDQTFVSTLAASPYASKYASATQQDLVQYANDFCEQLSSPPAPGLVEIMNMTPDLAAEKYFGTLAVNTYCPTSADALPGFFG